MPLARAAAASTLSSPVPARTTTLSVVVARSTSPVTLVPLRIRSAWNPSSAWTSSAPWRPTFSTTSWPAFRIRSRAFESALSVTRILMRPALAGLAARRGSRGGPRLVRGFQPALARASQRGAALLEGSDHREHVAQVVGPHVADAEDLALQVILSARHHDAVHLAQPLHHARRVHALGRIERGQ